MFTTNCKLYEKNTLKEMILYINAKKEEKKKET